MGLFFGFVVVAARGAARGVRAAPFSQATFRLTGGLTQSNKLSVFPPQADPFVMREYFIFAIGQSGHCRIHNAVVRECWWNGWVTIESALCRSNCAFYSFALTNQYSAKRHQFFHDWLLHIVFGRAIIYVLGVADKRALHNASWTFSTRLRREKGFCKKNASASSSFLALCST